MKFRCVNEMEQLSFDDSRILEFKTEDRQMEFTFDGARIKADNSQNSRYQDMYCGLIILQLENAEIRRFVKEGMKYYDADGRLLEEVADEDVPAPAQAAILRRLAKGKVFTVVDSPVDSGYAYEFGVDVPGGEDGEETDTFWLCITCGGTKASWDRYCVPADQ